MTDVIVQDHATAFIAQDQHFYDIREFVQVHPVPADDLLACAEGRFVRPTGQWDEAIAKFKDHRVLIVTGEPGTGRRTAALRLLADVFGAERVDDLKATWSQPRRQLLPQVSHGHGYFLDMTEPTDQPPEDDFGRKLRTWVQERNAGLVVVATDEQWARRWTSSAADIVVGLGSPDARDLVSRELQVASAADRIAALANEAFLRIWKSRPKAEGARRLARIIIRNGPECSPEQVVDEYLDWQDWIDRELTSKQLGARALMWSCAFCDGGQRKSVLRMADDLRRQLGEQRTPADILSDAPASTRLDKAKIVRDGDHVFLSPEQHGLAAAVRRHLWDEFEDQRTVLTKWLVSQLKAQPAEKALPVDDVAQIVDGLLDLAVHYQDDALLRTLRDSLTGDRRQFAVLAFSRAALDPRYGAHVRGLLYDWVTTSLAQEVVDLVADVCGGTFGEEKTGMALVRLGWAAQRSQPGNQALARAFTAIAARHHEEVVESIAKWFIDFNPPTAGINAFLALASTAEGAAMLCTMASANIKYPGFLEAVTGYFRQALTYEPSMEAAYSVIEFWEELVGQGALNVETVIKILGVALAPRVKDNILMRLYPGDVDISSFRGRVFSLAIQTAGIGSGVWVD